MKAKTIIRVSVVDQMMKFVEKPNLASGGLNEAVIAFDFCEKWDGFTKTGVFYRDEDDVYHAILDDNDTCVVPSEVYAEPGNFFFTVFGNKGDARRTANTLRYKAQKGLAGVNLLPSDPTPTVYEQILAKLGNGDGLATAEKSLILSLFKNAAYTADMSATITQLETLWSGEDVPVLPEADVSQTGSILSIVSGVAVTQSGSVLAIA